MFPRAAPAAPTRAAAPPPPGAGAFPASCAKKASQLKLVSATINSSLCHISIQPLVGRIDCGGLHALYLKGDPQPDSLGAAGKIAVIIAFAHAHPVALCIECGAGHQHQVQLLRCQPDGAAQNGRADAVGPGLPSIRAGHGGGQGELLPADGVGHRFAQCLRPGGQRGKVRLASECGVEQQGIRLCKTGQARDAGTKRRIGRSTLCRRQSPAGGNAHFALNEFQSSGFHRIPPFFCFPEKNRKAAQFPGKNYTDIINAGAGNCKGFGKNAVEEIRRVCYHKHKPRAQIRGRAVGTFYCQRGVVKMYDEMMDTIGLVGQADPELAAAMSRELGRQRENIELIASENIVSPAVMAAMGSVLTNKYAEGLPGKRYYGGCVYVDEVENIAIRRACELFGAKYANVQPHSGAQANLAVYFALLDLGDTVMGMDLSQGGHLTHGSPVNMSGKNYNFVPYGVNAEGVIDYAELEKQVKKVRPRMIVAGASAYPRAIDFEKLAEIAHGYGAYLMVDMAHIAGLVAGGQHQSPVPYADVVTTTTHKTLRGPRGGLILTNNPVIAKRINSAVFPGTQGGPLEHVIAAKAVCFGEALKPEFKEYARKIVENAQALAAALQERGVKLVSGGTDNHLMLIDLRDEECTGKDLEARLDSVHITANKNTVPGETRSPFVTSGVRLGTPAVTTRGMGVAEMKVIADCIADCIWHYDEKKDEISERVLKLTRDFPLYE